MAQVKVEMRVEVGIRDRSRNSSRDGGSPIEAEYSFDRTEIEVRVGSRSRRRVVDRGYKTAIEVQVVQRERSGSEVDFQRRRCDNRVIHVSARRKKERKEVNKIKC